MISNIKFIIFLLICNCCSSRINTEDSFKKVFEINADSLIEKPFFYSEIFSTVNYIKLETKKDNLIGSLRRLMVDDDMIYMFAGNGLFAFHKNGDFSFKLDNKGKGPGEFLNLNDIIIDNNRVEVLDLSQRKIISFDMQGVFIDEFRYDGTISSFFKLNNDNCYAFFANNRLNQNIFKDEKPFNIIIYKNGLMKKAFYPVTSFRKNIRYVPLTNFNKFENTTLFIDIFNDTIYSVTCDSFTPLYYIDFQEKKIDVSKFKDGLKYIEARKSISDAGLAQLQYFNESMNFIVFDFLLDKKKYIAIFCKKTSTMKITKGFVNDLEIDQISFPSVLFNDKLYFYYSADLFLKRYFKNKGNIDISDSQYLDIINSSSISDNPIIIEAQIKYF